MIPRCDRTGRWRPLAAISVVTVLASLAAGCTLTGSLEAPSAHRSSPAGGSGDAPTTASCERTVHVACYSPAQLQRAYDLLPLYRRNLDGRGRTIAIVDSFGSPTIRKDLATFDRDFGLAPPPSFRIIHPAGAPPPFRPTMLMMGWAFETSMDVEWAHALAPGAGILLVETPVAETVGVQGFPQIVESENYVIDHGLADVISQSLGAPEQTFPTPVSLLALRSAYVNAESHGVTVLAATGDTGPTSYRTGAMRSFFKGRVADWPASDPLVTAVGGTSLHLNASGARTSPDSVWNETVADLPPSGLYPRASSGGLSSIFSRPAFQAGVRDVVGTARGIPDVSMSAAADGSVLVCASFTGGGSCYRVGSGTSEATPEFAAVVAIADQAAGRRLGLLNPALYRLAAARSPGIVDVTLGNNTVSFRQGGAVHVVKGWPAVPGYDLASGLGTIDAAKLVDELAGMSHS
jgi:subtilase family serine protease